MKRSLPIRKWSTWAISTLALLLTLLTLSTAFNAGSAFANTPGAVDSTFRTNFGSLTTNRTYAVAVQSDGSVLFAGDFAGTFMKVSATGVADTTFNTNSATGSTVNSGRAIAIDSLGRIVVGDNAGGPLNRFSSTGVVDSTFNTAAATATGASGTGNAVAIYNSDSILVGGNFTGGLKKVSSTGAADATFNTNAASSVGTTVNTIAVQSDGKILVGGSFTGGLKRITSTGLADTTFNTNAAAAVGITVQSVVVQSDGTIIVGGSFTGKVKKLNADGTLAANFSTTPNNTVQAVAVQPDGKILVGGNFSGNLTRFNSDLTVDATFVVQSADLNAIVNSIAVKADGKIVVGTESIPSVRQFYGTYTAPGAPLAPVAVASDGQATITVAAGAGVTPTAYTVTAVQDNTKTCTVTGASGSCTITGLTNGTSYTFTATAINTVSTAVSPASPLSNAVTPLSNPIYQGAAVNAAGTDLTVTYSKALGSTPPLASAFEVKADGTLATVTNVSISGSTVVLTLDPKVGVGQVVTLKYTAPASSNLTSNAAIQNLAGEDAAALATTTITNSSTADITAPVFQSAAVNNTGGTVTLTYNEALGTIAPTANMFSLTAAGSALSTTNVAVSGTTIVLTVSPAILQGQAVLINYASPSPANPSISNSAIQDAAGNDSASLTAASATNGSLKSLTCSASKGAAGVGGSVRSNTQGGSGCVTVTYGSTTEEFNYVGAVHTWTVPAGVTSVTFKAYGAGGGATTSGGDLGAVTTYNGGAGGYVESTYSVTPGQSFYLTVGQGGIGNDTTKPLASYTIQQVSNAATGIGYLWVSSVSSVKVGDTITISGLTGSFAFFNGTKVTTTNTSGQAIYFTSGSATAISLTNMSGTVSAPQACVGSVMTSPFGSGGAASNTNCASNQNNLYASGGGGSSVFAVAATPRHLLTAGGGGGASLQGAGGTGGGNSSTALTGGNGTAGSGTGTSFGGGATQSAVGAAGGAASPTITGSIAGVAGTSKLTTGYGVAAGAASTGGGGGGGGGYYGGGSGSTGGGGGGGSSLASVLDLQAPVLASSGAAVLGSNGTSLVLTFNEALSATTAAASAFFVYVDGTSVAISSSSASGSTVTLNVTSAISGDKVVTVSYVAPNFNIETSNAAVQDSVGNDAVSFSNVAVTNNSTLGPDRIAPVLVTSNPVTFSGTQVTVAFNEPLQGMPLPPASAFTVFVAGVPTTPSSLTISGSNVLLTMPASITAGTEVIVSYEAPTSNTSPTNAAIQDTNGNDAVSFSQTSNPINSAWTWTTPYDATANAVTGCDGAGSTNRIKQTQLPNGVYYSVGVTGTYLCINDATESLAQRGGVAQNFTATGLVTEPGLKLTTANNNCTAGVLCGPRGTMTIYFSKPVKDPVVSFAGWGGGSGTSTAWTEMSLVTPGVTMSVLSGTNIEVVNNGTYIQPIVKNPSVSCSTNTGYGATATAGCGSIQINGTVSQVAFDVYLGTARGTGYLDAWNLTASISEDFGLVPSTYDNPVASHSIGDLKLGATVAADQSSALYATTNADAVARWTSLAGNPKADDGVAAWVSSPSINFGNAGSTYSTTVAVDGVTSVANLCSWIDFNRDEVFAYSERYCTTVQPGATSATLSWTVPQLVVPGLTYARVRISYDTLTVATGKVSSGEVEDYSMTIVPSAVPYAVADTSSGLKGATQSINILANDVTASGVTWSASSVKLCSSGQTPNNCTATTVTVAGEGTYTVQSDGTVQFVPLSSFTGTATPLGYQVTDSLGQIRSSTITPTVIGVPTANPNTTSGAWNTAQISDVLANDTAATGYSLTASSLKLCDPATNQASPNCNATSVTIANQGTYSIVSGQIQFTPLITFSGTATPIAYQVSDSLSQVASSIYTPTIAAPTPPVAVNDTSSGPLNTVQTMSVLSNDTSADPSVTLTAASVKLCNPATSQVAPNCSATSVTIANQGTYSVNTTTGVVSFTPVNNWSGTATEIGYQVTANSGQVVSAIYTPTVIPGPTVAADTTSGPWNTTQTKNVLSNDSSASQTTLNPASLALCASGQTAPNCNATSVTIANEGTYSIVTGQVQFVPLSSFAGTATAVTYQVADALGQVASTTYTPTVSPPASSVPVNDINSGPWNTAQTITPLANDPAGLTMVGLCLTSQTTAANCTSTSLTIANEGTYTLNGSTVTFTPLSTFSGTATPIAYAVSDSFNQKVEATITPTVAAPTAPTATPQTLTVIPGASIYYTDVDSGVGSLSSQGSAAITASCIVNPSNTSSCISSGSFTVANQGTWSINNGVVTFAAAANVAPGTQTPITYRVTDSAGLTASSTLTAIVPAPPTAVADTSSGAWNTTQTKSVLANDSAASGLTLDSTTLKLCDPATNQVSPNCNATSVTVANQGTYSVVSGSIQFVPLISFTGTATAVSYQISDSLGQSVSTTYTPTVVAPVAPVAVNDTSSGPLNTAQVKTVLANDTTAAGVTLNATSVKLCSSGQTSPNCTATSVTIANQGTYTVNTTTGDATFTPVTGWSGTATAVAYQVTANSGQVVSATYTPTVIPAPTVVLDTTSGAWNTVQTSNVLANDAAASGTTLTASTLKLCSTGQTSPNCTATSVTIANQGTYAVVNGQIQFTPLSTFAGTATAVTYQISDALGQVASTTYTPTVAPPAAPIAVSDTNSGAWNTAQTITPLSNDPAGVTIVGLCPTVSTAAASCTATTLTIANQGTYTLSGSTVTFTPLPTFSGTATPIKYAVVDAFNQYATANITPTVAAPTAPTATPQTKTLLPSTTVTFTDVDSGAGALATQGSAAITSSCIVNPANTSSCITSGSFTVANQGTWTIASGVVTFAALANVTPGTQTSVTYRVTDLAGLTASSTLTPIVPAAPVATTDTSSGAWNTAQTMSVLTNDTAATGETLVASTLKLCDPATSQVSPNCNATSVTIAGQGTYTVSNGSVVFTPLINFIGTATPVAYQISDSLGQTATTTYTPTVVAPVAPVAVNDTSSGPLNVAQVKTVLTNDTTAAGVTLTATSVKLCSSSQTSPNCTATSVTISGQGTYVVDTSTGVVTFTPVNNWSGTATAVTYQVTANSGQVVSATYTPTVIPAPTVVADTTSGPYNTVQTSNVLLNDAAASGTTLAASTLKLCATGQTSPNCNATSVTIANQGTYAIVNGSVTFTPLSTFAGTATPVSYQVSDALGQTSTTTYTPTVTPPPLPVAVNDTKSGPWNTPQTITPLTNDPAGLTIVGLCPSTQTVAASCTLTSVTVYDSLNNAVGTYTLSGTTVTFTPAITFSGTAPAIKYAVADVVGQKVMATITPTVAAPAAPIASPQTKTLLPATTTTFTDVDSGASPLATTGSANFVSSCIVNPATPSSCITSGSFVVAGEGTWSINSGVVTFAALANITPGTKTPVTYTVVDAAGLSVSSTLTPIVPQPPVASPDSSAAPQGTVQTLSILTNDTAGAASSPLVQSTVRLCTMATVNASCTLTSLTVAGEGVYSVNPSTGVVTFTPDANYVGIATPIKYVVQDSLGQIANSTISPVVVPPPAVAAVTDTLTLAYGATGTFNPLTNDSAGITNPIPVGYTAVGTVSLNTSTLKLCGVGETYPSCTANTVTTVDGTYVLNGTTVVFTPVAGFTGTAVAPPTYLICNAVTGTWLPAAPSTSCATAQLIPTVTPPANPTATPDTSTNYVNTLQTMSVLANDSIPAIAVPSTLRLCGTNQTAPTCTATSVTTADGTFTVVGSTITFMPVTDFVGTAAAISYVVTDQLNHTVSSTYTPTVTPPPPPPPAPPVVPTPTPTPTATPTVSPTAMPKPIAKPDIKTGPMNRPITLVPVANDIKAAAELVATSVVLCTTSCEATANSVETKVGVWAVDPSNGNVTFTPVKNWFGRASLGYFILDAAGNRVKSTLTVIIPKAHIKGDLAYTGVSEFTWPIAAIAALLIGFGIWLRRRSR